MSRWVSPPAGGLVAGEDQADGIAGRIVKYVPAEIVAPFTMIYTGAVALDLPANQGKWFAVSLIVFFLFITIAYIVSRTEGSVRRAHLFVSSLAFLAWAYPISSALLGDFFRAIAALILQAVVVGLSIVVRPS